MAKGQRFSQEVVDKALAQEQVFGGNRNSESIKSAVPLSVEGPAMNKNERNYSVYLNVLKSDGVVVDWKFEEVTFLLAGKRKSKRKDKMEYTPDFMVIYQDHIEFVDVKGGRTWEDSVIKWKAAKDRYPYFRFRMLQFKDNQWKDRT